MDRIKDMKKEATAAKNVLLDKMLSDGNDATATLWGMLHVKIIKCEKLRNLDRLGVHKIITTGKRDKSDPYVMAFVNDYRLLKTRHYDDELSPVFNEEFWCPVAHNTGGVLFDVRDRDQLTTDDTIGKYLLPVGELVKAVDEADVNANPDLSPGDLKRVGVHKIVYLDGKKSHGSLEFFCEFIPNRYLSKSLYVPGVYFDPTKGNEVKLYMNADDDGSSPIVKYGGENDDEKVWTPPRLWRDIYDKMCGAKHMIYAVGWSFDTDQYLLRGQELEEALANEKYSPKLGELLAAKAEEGVVVNLMQWDDQSSNFAFPGMMGTFDEKTREFFKKTKVNARMVPMSGGEENTILQGTNKKLAFTHHQKFIVCDAPKPDGDGRELYAFVGGIDLTLGRWDNQKVRALRVVSFREPSSLCHI